jgi:hypothetical protein
MNDEAGLREFDQAGLGEAGDNAVDVDFEKSEKPAIGDVAGGDEKKPGRMTGEDVGVEKVGILGDDDGSIVVCDGGDGGVRGAVSGGQIKGVAGVVTEFAKPDGQKAGKLGINEKIHEAGSGSKRLTRASLAA